MTMAKKKTEIRRGIPSHQWLSRTLIESPIHYALCLNEKQFYEEMARLKVPKHQYPSFLGAHGHAATHHIEFKGKPVSIVCLGSQEGRTEWEVLGLLVHEAVHIWQEMCLNIGEREPSAEFEAYSVQWIAQELMRAWNHGRGRSIQYHSK